MEKILVGMNPAQTLSLAGVHALNLANRINAKVSFLLVFPSPPKQSGKPVEKQSEATAKKKVEALIEKARSDGILVDYYLTYGDYENELVSFAQQNKVTLLVVETTGRQGNSKQNTKALLEKLRHRINCRIEVVNEKSKTPERKE